MANKTLNTRIIQKHDIEANWKKATNFIPMKGEVIIYDAGLIEEGKPEVIDYIRIKIGDGETNVNALSFATADSVLYSKQTLTNEQKAQARANIGAMSADLENYILNIDYDTLLAFDTSEIVISAISTTSVLGRAILGQLVLA